MSVRCVRGCGNQITLQTKRSVLSVLNFLTTKSKKKIDRDINMPYKDPDQDRRRKRKYYLIHREEVLKRRKQHYDKNAERIREQQSKYYIAHRKEVSDRTRSNREYIRDRNRLRKYGVTRKQWEEILESQENRCQICRCSFSVTKVPYIDHNHSTGSVRGALCNSCNKALGHLFENVNSFHNAITYLCERGTINESY